MLDHKIVPVNTITLEKLETIINEIFDTPETKTIYIPNKGIATIPIKEYRKMMFGYGCLICSKEMEERINKAVVEDFHKSKYELFSSKLLNNNNYNERF